MGAFDRKSIDMFVLVKRIIVYLFSIIGIGLYRLPEYKKRRQSTPEWEEVEAYLVPNRLKFYDDMVHFMCDNGIDCNNKKVADVGCFTGHMLLKISEVFQPLSMTGLDNYEWVIKTAAPTFVPEAKFYVHDIMHDTAQDYKFDVVICLETLEHILFPTTAIRNLLGMTSRPGTLILSVPNGRIDTFRGHINFWSPESWEVFIKDTCINFDVETGIKEKGNLFAIIRVT